MTDFPKITLETEGSTGEIYEISILKHEDHLRMTCTCPAGRNSNITYCKHRAAIILGDFSQLVEQPADADLINEEIAKTNWRAEIEEINQLNKEVDKLKRKIKNAKRDVVKSLNGKLDISL
jgi:uncharacterized Zn finger protein